MKENVKKVISNCLDDNTKAKSKLNKNYFFITTIFFIALNILIYAFFKTDLSYKYRVVSQDWNSILNFKCLFSAIINNISHGSWEHVLLNMFPVFFITSIYLERKFGSVKHFLIILLSIIVSAAFVSGNHQDLGYVGWSCVNSALMGFFIISYFFSLNKREKTNGNLIYGTITFICVFVFLWWKIWEVDASDDLIRNMGHYSGFLAGIIIGLTIYLTKLFVYQSIKNNLNSDIKYFTTNKIVNSICISISILLCAASVILACIVR